MACTPRHTTPPPHTTPHHATDATPLCAQVTIDGKHREMNGRTLAAAALCALRPDRVLAFVRTHVEPQCLKVNLEETLGCAAAAPPRRLRTPARPHAIR